MAGAGSLTVSLGLDAAEYVDGLSKAEQQAKSFADKQTRITASIDKQIATLQRQASQIGLTTREIKLMDLAQKGATQTQLSAADASLKALESAGAAAVGHAAGIAGASKATHEFSLANAGATRELLVLTHEMSQGNFKRFGGSLLVLANQTGLAGTIFSGFGAIALGLIATLGGLGYAFIEGAKQSKAFADAMRTTGDFAGVTEGQFNALVKSVATTSGATVSASREILQALISTGEFGPKLIGAAAEAGAKFEKATGQSADEVAKDFAKMSDGVAKWAAEHNKSLNYITLAQYTYIKQLEDQGQVEQAELVNLKALSDHFGGSLTQNLGTLERTLNTVKHAWANFWDAAFDIGRTKTIEQKIADIDKQIDASQARAGGQFAGDNRRDVLPARGANQATLQDQRTALVKDQFIQQEHELAKAEDARIQKEGIGAKQYLDHLKDEFKGTERINDELNKYHTNLEKFRAAGGQVSAAEQAKTEQDIRNKFSDKHSDRSQEEQLKKTLEGQIKLVREFASEQKDAFDFANQYLQGAYADGLVSLQDYFTEQKRIRDASIQSQIDQQDKEIALQQEFLKKFTDPKDQIDATNKIKEAQEAKNKILEKGAYQAVLAVQSEDRAAKQLVDRYNDLRATIFSLQGNDFAASQIKIAQQVRSARELLTQAGKTPTTGDFARSDRGQSSDLADANAANSLERLLKDQAALTEARKKYGLTLDELSIKEGTIDLAVQKGSISEIEGLLKVGEARKAQIALLEDQLRIQEEIAARSDDPTLRLNVEKTRLELEKLKATLDPLGKQLNDTFSGEFSTAFSDFISHTKSASDAFKSFANSVVQDINKMVAKSLSDQIFKSTNPGGFISSLLSGGSSLFGGSGTTPTTGDFARADRGQASSSSSGGGLSSLLNSAFSFFSSGGLAGGGPAYAGSLHQVAENRPEMLDVNGKSFLLMGSQRGNVDPNPSFGSGKSQINNITVNVPQGTSRSDANQVAAAVAKRLTIANARFN